MGLYNNMSPKMLIINQKNSSVGNTDWKLGIGEPRPPLTDMNMTCAVLLSTELKLCYIQLTATTHIAIVRFASSDARRQPMTSHCLSGDISHPALQSCIKVEDRNIED